MTEVGPGLTAFLIEENTNFKAQVHTALGGVGCNVYCVPDESFQDAHLASSDSFFAGAILPLLLSRANLPSASIFLINVNLRLGTAGKRSAQTGIELLKHIRLTPELGELRKCHVILYSFESGLHLLKRKPNNLILCSPSVTLLRLPEGMSRLLGKEFPETDVTKTRGSGVAPLNSQLQPEATKSLGSRLLEKLQTFRAFYPKQKEKELPQSIQKQNEQEQNASTVESPQNLLNSLAVHTADVSLPSLTKFVQADLQTSTERAYIHSYLNRAGVPKFLREFAGTVIKNEHPLAANFQKLARTELQWKQIAYLCPEVTPGRAPEPTDAASFSSTAGAHSYLYIDDEHSSGWSLGLYSGLFGSGLTDDAYEHLCDGDTAETPDRRFFVIRSRREVTKFIESRHQDLEAALENWAGLTVSLNNAKKKVAEVDGQCRAAEAQFSARQANYDTATRAVEARSKDVEKISQKLVDAIREFEDVAGELHEEVATDPRGTGGAAAIRLLEDNREKIEQLSNSIPLYSESRASKISAEKDVARSKEALDGAAQEVGRLRPMLTTAQKNRDDLANLLQQGQERIIHVFPYSMVFLDLRLDPAMDEAVPVEAMSGVRALQTFKEVFPHAPVIIFTASQQALSAEAVRALGADGYWVKGMCTGEELRAQVKNCLAKAAMSRVWIRLQQLKHKPELICREWYGDKFVPRTLDKSNRNRQFLESLLEDSFWLIWRNCPTNGPDCDISGQPFNDVFRILGVAQEIYYDGIGRQGDSSPLWEKIEGDDGKRMREFHKRRNDLSHLETRGGRGGLKKAWESKIAGPGTTSQGSPRVPNACPEGYATVKESLDFLNTMCDFLLRI